MGTYVPPKQDDPDVKWIIRHSRMTDTLTFGPFDSLREAQDWAIRNEVDCFTIPLLPPRVEEGGYDGLWGGWAR